MKLGFSQQEIIETAKSLGLPQDGFVQRRIARAYDLVSTDKVTEVTDGIFRVRSQYEPDKAYIVNLNHGEPSCDCPDGERTINCKHRIASLLYAQRQAQAITIIKTTDGEEGDYWRRCWLIAQGNIRPIVYEERDRRLFCNCGAYYGDCEHKQLVIVERAVALPRLKPVTKELKEKRIINECGSERAKEIQERLNSQNNNGNGAHKAPSQLDISNPFEESESYDIDQIEGRRNGEVTWKLKNGEVVISYKGIMTLAEKHGIEFVDTAINEDTNTVIAKAKNGRLCGEAVKPCERVSGKPINDGLVDTAMELAKRNAARQLLPLAEIKAIEHKAKLESEFNWQVAYHKCCEVASGRERCTIAFIGKPQCDIVIHELVKNGKLRQAGEGVVSTHRTLCFEYNRIEWRLIYETCKRDAQVERDPKSLNRWSYNSAEFLDQCREAIAKVREKKDAVEANEQPLENGNGKRKIQMDKKLRTWLVESDGTKTEISCREICEKFESEKNPRIVTRLRAGIDSGADFSTVELN